MLALPPVRPSDCSVVLCKAALPLTLKEGQDRCARAPAGRALTKAPHWLGEGPRAPLPPPARALAAPHHGSPSQRRLTG